MNMNLLRMGAQAGGLMRSRIVPFVLAAWFPALAAAYPAHYFVVQEAADGHLEMLAYRQVELAGSPGELVAQRDGRRLESPLAAELLDKSSGNAVFRTSALASPWLRGEFHGKGIIDAHVFAQEVKTYVVRLPMQAGTRLRLTSSGGTLSANASSKPAAGALPTLEIDLDDYPGTVSPVALPAGYATGSLIASGDPSNRLDLLIVAEGYTAAQQSSFVEQAGALAAKFLAASPYSDFSQLINVNWLFVPSGQSGADKPYCAETPGEPVVAVDTAFDGTFCTYGIRRLVTVNSGKVLSAAASVPDWDKLMVLVNDAEYGGSGGNVGVATTNESAAEIMQHEFGHSFTLLADEYEDAYPGYPACSDLNPGSAPCEANVTDWTTRTGLKWARWVDPATPIPTSGWLADRAGAGLWLGARYQTQGMYRQCFAGMMRYLGMEFCHVDSEAFVKRLYAGGWGAPAQGISLIDPGSTPAGAEVSSPAQARVEFQAKLAGSRATNGLTATWFADGVQMQQTSGEHGGQTTFSYLMPDSNNHVVELRVSDASPFLLDAVTKTRQWTIRGLPAGSCSISSFGQTVSGRGGSGSVNISGGAVCSWTAASNASWISITSAASGSGSATVTFSVAANNGAAARTGTLSIAGQTYTVTQTGVSPPGAPTLLRLVAGRDSMTAYFNPPDSDGGADITQYVVSCQGGGQSHSNQGSASPIRVGSLVFGTSYRCSVHATNAAGAGAESSSITRVARKTGTIPLLLLLDD